MDAKYKGIIFSIVFLMIIWLTTLTTSYIIFSTGTYGNWNECINQFNYDNIMTYYLTEDLANTRCGPGFPTDDPKWEIRNNCLEDLEKELEENEKRDRVDKCGNRPKMPLANFRVIINNVNHFFFDGSLQMFIPLGQFQNSFLLILTSFIVGHFIDKKKR